MKKTYLSLMIFVLFAFWQCASRQDTAQWDADSPDAGVDSSTDVVSDAATDASDASDAAVHYEGCGEAPLEMAFSLSTQASPLDTGDEWVEEYHLFGTLLTHGPIEDDYVENPLLRWEALLEQEDGTTSLLQYGLPHDRKLPLIEGALYSFSYRIRYGHEGETRGLRVNQEFFGREPMMLFIGDTGSYGRAFSEQDPLIDPLRIAPQPLGGCDPLPDDLCGGDLVLDQMYFVEGEEETYPRRVTLLQGTSAVYPLLGSEYLATNLKSYHLTDSCPDAPSSYYSYMVLHPPQVDTCDASRVEVMYDTFHLGVGCDDIQFCATPDLAESIKEVAPALRCYPEEQNVCGGEMIRCVWWVPTNQVGPETYYEVCRALDLLEESQFMRCNVYL